MTLGEILELLAAALLIAAAAIWSGLVLALAVAAVCAVYFAQCYADTTFRRVESPPGDRPQPGTVVARRDP